MLPARDLDIAFGPFKLDYRERGLTRDGVPIILGGRAFDVLAALASADGQTVGKDALLDRAWPGLTVEQNNLQVQISALRKSLGEGWIVTVPGRGYRLMMSSSVVKPSAYAGEPATKPEASGLPFADQPSIAVLPFANLSGDVEQEYFSDGLAEDILTKLSRNPSMFVIARSSSFAYRGHSVDVKQAARELGVRYVLEGSVRRVAGRVRVTAQLIHAETGRHIWAERYDGDLDDVLSLQDGIAESLAIAINPAVDNAELKRAVRKLPENLGAWEAYQRGIWHLGKASTADNDLAKEFFKRATELDPTFATPHAMLAYTHAWDVASGNIPPDRAAIELAGAEARRAIELDPGDSTALAVLSWAATCEGHYDAGLDRAVRAISAAPNNAIAWHAKGRALTYLARFSEARVAIQMSLQLSPHGPASWFALNSLIISHYFERDYAAAAQVAERTIEGHPEFPLPYRWLAAALGQLGRTDAANEALRNAIALVSPRSFELHVHRRIPWFRPENHEHMLDGLRKAGWQS